MARRRRRREARPPLRGPGNAYPLELRLRAVREVIERGLSTEDVSRAFGVGHTTLANWLAFYRERGVDGLVPMQSGPRPRPVLDADPLRDAVTDARREHPEHGTRRIRDVLARFEGLGVSETVVRRILHEEGLLEDAPEPRGPREHPPRRFERAEPNQLW